MVSYLSDAISHFILFFLQYLLAGFAFPHGAITWFYLQLPQLA